ncbi:MAG: VCBS repeat-containing protein [Thermoplasmata archaeon]|nr:VCBS repeat-containing protein [Thermoplasmata archaeon]
MGTGTIGWFSSKRMFSLFLLSIFILLSISTPMGAHPDDFSVQQTRAGEVTFTNVSVEVGLDGVSGNFFSWGDYDNDGHEDLLIDGKKLFQNTGPPHHSFVDVTEKAGIDRPVNSGVFGDYDNDGWLDIFCGGGRGSNDHPQYPDILWHNERDGTFRDVTASSGHLSDTFPTVAGAWADVDRDGYLDLYMANYENGSLAGYNNHFWHNQGDGTFDNGTVEFGFDEGGDPLQSRGASWTDVDNDGWQDLYVSNYRIRRNYLYMNDGAGAYVESAEEKGVEGHGNTHPVTGGEIYYGHSVGSSWGDLDNDGDMDLWVTNLAHKDAWRGPICDDSYLFENLGEEMDWGFIDRRAESGIEIKEIPGAVRDGDELMVSSSLADYDNDGDLDLFIPQIYGDVSYSYSFLYRNDGGLRFTEVGEEAGLRVWNTYGSAWCDYDQDGWIDLITGGGTWDADLSRTTNSNVHLFRNNGGDVNTGSRWLEVKLEGRESNRAAIGARVTVEVDRDGDGTMDHMVIREVQAGTAAHGQQDPMLLHFGLGTTVSDAVMTVDWPMGRRTVHRELDLDGVVRIFEPTENIEVNLSLDGASLDEGVIRLDHTFENPSAYQIRDRLFLITVNDGQLISEKWVREPIGPGDVAISRIDLDAGGVGALEKVTMELLRSYPPTIPAVDTLGRDDLINHPPTALLSGPEEVELGSSVTLSGEGSHDADGVVVEYRFDLGDGSVSGWVVSPTIQHSYGSAGIYRAVLSVKDEKGSISPEDAYLTIRVVGHTISEPIAHIIDISPNDALSGEEISFEGEGIPSTGEAITDHEWSSSLDGRISSRAAFSTDILLVGYHEITYRVRDSGGSWSKIDSSWVSITLPEVEKLWASINGMNAEAPLSGDVIFSGSSGPVDRMVGVEVRIDSDPWTLAPTYPDWTFWVDCDRLSDDEHIILARSTDGMGHSQISQMNFTVLHEDDVSGSTIDNEAGGVGISVLTVVIGVMAVAVIALLVGIVLQIVRRRDEDIL